MTELKEFDNGFKYLEIKNSFCNAKVSLQGAHIFEFTPHDAKPLLWVSEASKYEYGESIRGGIPICWPWFGMNKHNQGLPQHGFARTAFWSFSDAIELEESTKIMMMLSSSDETKKLFPYEFELSLTFYIGKELKLELKTKNCDKNTFNITQALHTYFDISDTSNISILGLGNKPYLDALDMQDKRQEGEIKIDKEVDRVYQDVTSEIKIKDTNNSISIKNKGSRSAVVWNPWTQKCSRMSAMKKDSYKTFVCVETANAFDDEIQIKPNQSHTLQTTISFV